MKFYKLIQVLTLVFLLTGLLPGAAHGQRIIVDSFQEQCYNNATQIGRPAPDEPFYGQDAQFERTSSDYQISSDGLTVLDNTTGLTWIRLPDTNGDGNLDSDDKLTWVEFQSYPGELNAVDYGGYDDWRIPTIKELYSLIDFRGLDPSGFTGDEETLVPFIATEYFDFAYGDESTGERIIDAQYWSGTEYLGTTMGGAATAFGVNFADGRIKGYPRDTGPDGSSNRQFARLVRGDEGYGVNEFVDNNDGTVTDNATGLMWSQSDSGEGMTWEAALAWIQERNAEKYLGYGDWRLPDVKALQSIVDYTQAPSVTNSPAINPVFEVTAIVDEGGGVNFPFYWSSTTHVNWSNNPGAYACYIAFGEALGWMEMPPNSGQYVLTDVHGAGAQRSDPKTGNPADWPYGHGPQGDVIRIYNFVRCVRDVDGSEPTPTPVPPETGVRLDMPATYFHPGDSFMLTATLYGDGETAEAPLCVILAIDGVFWFWPTWTETLDYRIQNLESGERFLTIIEPFDWPETGSVTMDGCEFYAALLSDDFSEILGGVDGIGFWSFGFGAEL